MDQIIQKKGETTTYIPRSVWEGAVNIGDRTARTLAVLGLLIGVGGTGVGAIGIYLSLRQQPVSRDVDPELKHALEANLVGDCFNENVLRQALGSEMVTLEECAAEREEWIRNQ